MIGHPLQMFRSLRKAFAASATNHSVPFNEPGGSLFNVAKNEKVDWAQRIYIWGYLGGLAAFAFLWQYRPDTSAETWAKNEALRRMRERGVDLSLYEE